MAIVFNKTPKNKKFNYRPLYYDEKKEEREKRMKSALEESNEEDYEKALRERIQSRWKRTAGTRARKASNQRLIIIIMVIAMLFYLAFFL